MKITQPAVEAYWQEKFGGQATPVQAATFDGIKSGSSYIVQSATGTGKTLAYLLPILEQVEANQSLQVIIMVPSQELAAQITGVAKEWGQLIGINAQSLSGGANLRRQVEGLKDKPEIIVATPGRLLEIMNQSRKLKVHTVKHLVYDEADYLFTPEHQASMIKIQQKLMRDVQVIWVSATISEELERFAKELRPELKEYQSGERLSNIQHYAVLSPNRKKTDLLKRLAHHEGMRALIFFEQIAEIEAVESKLGFEGIPVVSLHSQQNASQRQQAVKLFTEGKAIFLLTTDVASRGLDIEDVPFIIHYNKPLDATTYLHRSGRTGRGGKSGQVISLVNEQEFRDLQPLLIEQGVKIEERILFEQRLIKPEDKVDQPKIQVKKVRPSSPQGAKDRIKTAPKAKKKQRHRLKKDLGKPKNKHL